MGPSVKTWMYFKFLREKQCTPIRTYTTYPCFAVFATRFLDMLRAYSYSVRNSRRFSYKILDTARVISIFTCARLKSECSGKIFIASFFMAAHSSDFSRYLAAITHKYASSKPGLWANIRAKRERGGKPAKPGDKDYPDSKSWKKVTNISSKKEASSPAWQREEGKNEEGGLNAKGRASYNKATGGNLKAPVTESNPKGDRAKRQNSFCARMCGMKRVNTGGKTKKDPDSRINKSLRKWNCKCGSDEEKQAMIPGVIGGFAGAAGGALTGKKNKVNRAIGRGALIGAATELGMAPGMALGMIPGAMLGNAIAGPEGAKTGLVLGGGLGMGAGGVLGNAAAQGLLGPYETEEELAQELEQEKQEEQKMAAFEFGRKLAQVTMCDAPKHNDQSGVDVNPVAAGTPEGKEKLTKKKAPVKAEDVVTSKAALFGRKLAQSLVNFVERKPKDLTKGTLNPHAAGEQEEDTAEPENEEDDGLIV